MSYLRNIIALTGLAFMFLGGCTTYAAAQDECSNKSLKGGYGFNVSGTNVGLNVQFAITGRFLPDGNGHFTGKATQSVAGHVDHTTFDGTYTVNSDCSGTAVFQFQSGIKATLDFILVKNATEIYIIDADNGTIETGSAKKQF
jgi:hypothetical protein